MSNIVHGEIVNPGTHHSGNFKFNNLTIQDAAILSRITTGNARDNITNSSPNFAGELASLGNKIASSFDNILGKNSALAPTPEFTSRRWMDNGAVPA